MYKYEEDRQAEDGTEARRISKTPCEGCKDQEEGEKVGE